MLLLSWNFEMTVGLASGVVMIAAILYAPLFRTLMLVAAAAIITYILTIHGAPGVVRQADSLYAAVLGNLDFSKGMLIGLLAGTKLLLLLRALRPR
jgi:hypothetical protein